MQILDIDIDFWHADLFPAPEYRHGFTLQDYQNKIPFKLATFSIKTDRYTGLE
nr:hypothetical protein [Methanosarcina barkeri]